MKNKIKGYTLILIAFISLTVVRTFDLNVIAGGAPPISLVLSVVLGGIASVTFWGWMFRDLVKRGDIKNKYLWALVLLMLYFLGAVIYFLIKFQKSEKAYKK